MEKRTIYAKLAGLTLIAIVLGIGISSSVPLPNGVVETSATSETSNYEISEKSTITRLVCTYVDKIGVGQNIPNGCTYNVITNTFKNYTRDMWAFLSGSKTAEQMQNVTVLQLSTNGTVDDETVKNCTSVITGNGLDIGYASTAVNNDDIGNYTITKKFEATGTQADIRKVCFHNSTIMTNMPLLASALISNTSLVNTENLTIIAYIGIV